MAAPDSETKKIVDAGGIIIEVLAQKAFGPTTVADLNAWVNAPGLKVTSLIDPEGGSGTIMEFAVRETAVIVDLRTMKIVKKINGDTTGTSPSSITTMLTAMATYVGL